MVVGSIETVTQGVITPPTTRTVRELPEVGRAFVKGEELGRFRLGSTVVMLSAPGAWRYHPTWAPRRKVRLHEVMAQMA
jgi:phosphatidylserine decarboxylase